MTDYQFKVIFIGDANSGKTTLISQEPRDLRGGASYPINVPKIGASTSFDHISQSLPVGKDLITHKIKTAAPFSSSLTPSTSARVQTPRPKSNYIHPQEPTIGIDYRLRMITLGSKRIKCHIYDSGGSETYRALTLNYYRDVYGVFICFDVSNIDSFKHLPYWLKEVQTNCNPGVSIGLIGNKIDLPRLVSSDEGEVFKTKHKLDFYCETSAKAEIHALSPAFELMAANIIAKIHSGAFLVSSPASLLNKKKLAASVVFPITPANANSRNCCVIL